jgi:uroporphyrinogen-III decarboxylase
MPGMLLPSQGELRMTSRERFRKTMRFEPVDRVPCLEEGIRKDVLKAWYRQGLSKKISLNDIVPADRFDEIIIDVDPIPEFKQWPTRLEDLDTLKNRLNPNDKSRLPDDWKTIRRKSQKEDTIIFMRLHRGFFLTMGVYGWQRFNDLMLILVNNPEFVSKYMIIYGEFTAALFNRVLAEIKIDAAIFSEPIGGNEGSLISPEMYEEFALKSYVPLLTVLKDHGVATIIFRTYANSRVLIPKILEYGFNCLWACETSNQAMDYRDLRREFGKDLRLLGGIDVDVLRYDQATIRREVEAKVPPLLADGGYIPLADGRVRADVPWENYLFYRRLLTQLTTG